MHFQTDVEESVCPFDEICQHLLESEGVFYWIGVVLAYAFL